MRKIVDLSDAFGVDVVERLLEREIVFDPRMDRLLYFCRYARSLSFSFFSFWFSRSNTRVLDRVNLDMVAIKRV